MVGDKYVLVSPEFSTFRQRDGTERTEIVKLNMNHGKSRDYEGGNSEILTDRQVVEKEISVRLCLSK